MDADASGGSRPHPGASASTAATSTRTEPRRGHPDHDWFFVIEGRVRLRLGDRDILVEAGEAAEFSTMTPHAIEAVDAPAEVIMIFDREDQRAHVHHGVVDVGGRPLGGPGVHE